MNGKCVQGAGGGSFAIFCTLFVAVALAKANPQGGPRGQNNPEVRNEPRGTGSRNNNNTGRNQAGNPVGTSPAPAAQPSTYQPFAQLADDLDYFKIDSSEEITKVTEDVGKTVTEGEGHKCPQNNGAKSMSDLEADLDQKPEAALAKAIQTVCSTLGKYVKSEAKIANRISSQIPGKCGIYFQIPSPPGRVLPGHENGYVLSAAQGSFEAQTGAFRAEGQPGGRGTTADYNQSLSNSSSLAADNAWKEVTRRVRCNLGNTDPWCFPQNGWT